jgi:hypothetical protein
MPTVLPKPGSPAETATKLRLYNQWRRGEGAWEWKPNEHKGPPFAPKELGELIDHAASLLDALGTEKPKRKGNSMSLDKAIAHGKEKRKPYRGAKAVDATCRNHGSCPRCQGNRKHKILKQQPVGED